MRRPLVIVAALAALTAGGAAVAVAASDELFPANPRERQARLARELAANLDGVTAGEVQRALERVRERHMAAHRADLARDLAPRLDVSVDEVERALDKAHEQMEQAFESGRRPEPGTFVKTLADELGKSEAQVRDALRAAHRARLKERLDAAVEAGRLTREQADRILEHAEQGRGPFGHGPGPGGPGGPMGGPPAPPR